MWKKYFLIAIFIVLIDQFLKYFFPYKVKNYGASFNLLENYKLILISISILAIILFLFLFFKTKENKLGLSFLISGTFSNLIDRIFLGYVIDYIPFFNLFTFNLADLSNTIGVLILIIITLKNEK